MYARSCAIRAYVIRERARPSLRATTGRNVFLGRVDDVRVRGSRPMKKREREEMQESISRSDIEEGKAGEGGVERKRTKIKGGQRGNGESKRQPFRGMFF